MLLRRRLIDYTAWCRSAVNGQSRKRSFRHEIFDRKYFDDETVRPFSRPLLGAYIECCRLPEAMQCRTDWMVWRDHLYPKPSERWQGRSVQSPRSMHPNHEIRRIMNFARRPASPYDCADGSGGGRALGGNISTGLDGPHRPVADRQI